MVAHNIGLERVVKQDDKKKRYVENSMYVKFEEKFLMDIALS